MTRAERARAASHQAEHNAPVSGMPHYLYMGHMWGQGGDLHLSIVVSPHPSGTLSSTTHPPILFVTTSYLSSQPLLTVQARSFSIIA